MVTLVTGGAGFVGRHLVSALRARGESVRVFDLAEGSDVVGSIIDRQAAAKACAGASTVFHLAGNAQLWARRRKIFDEVNHQGTKIVLEAARQAGVQRFVHCSSLTTLVGKHTRKSASTVDERLRLKAKEMLGPYPRSKLLAERAVEKAVHQDGLDAVIAIPTEPLGPGDDSLTPPTQMILDFMNGKNPAYIDCMLNFVPVDSLAEGLIAARDRGVTGERYLLAGENISMRRLLSLISQFSDRNMPSLKLPYIVALMAGLVDTGLVASLTGRAPKAPLTGVRLAGRRVSFSHAKAKNDLGWEVGSVQKALRDTLKWFDETGRLKPR